MTIGSNTWEIVEHFTQPSQESLIAALVNGTNAISLDIQEPLNEREREEIFRDIDLSMIHLYLDGTEEGIHSVRRKGMNATFPLALAARKSPVAEKEVHYRAPSIKAESFEDDCLHFLRTAKDYLHLNLSVFFTLSNAYLRNIIHLRTLRLLWEHMKASTSPPLASSLKIIASSPHFPYETRSEEDIVYATTHLLAGSLGSADGILLRASDKDGHPPDFIKRITRNLHHLATYEGKLDLQHDPLAGSYYIEKETLQLGEKIWNNFKA